VLLLQLQLYTISGDDTKGAEAEETEANVVVEIEKIIDALELDDCSYTLAKTTYTAADISNNGSYKFKATGIEVRQGICYC